LVFQLPWEAAMDLLIEWLRWAFDCGIEPCVDLAVKIADHLDDIINTIDCGLSNARLESMNTRLRLIMRRSFGFHSPEPLIALAMLSQGGMRALPSRALTDAA
jgi:transposase